MSCPARIYPFHKPKNHRVPIPRWTLSLPEDVKQVYTAYIGVQQHIDDNEAANSAAQATQQVKKWLVQDDGPATHESFTVIDDDSTKDVAVWVCYWNDLAKHKSSMEKLSLSSIHSSLSSPSIGLWRETFTSSVSRLETNYSGLDYLPGLARLPRADTVEHTLSAYWGAARDRIPDSAHDLFPRAAESPPSNAVTSGRGKHLLGTNHANLVHIRSGQYWENCSQMEADAYEQKLEPTLRSGLQYLQQNPADTGAIALRYMQNADLPYDPNARQKKESCGSGFFANLEDLERWAHTHQSHLKIYRGALAHYKEFGDLRKFRTWHEVSVIGESDAKFEYVNCDLDPGVGEGTISWGT
ncbi:hypothetical protein HBH47_194230 [Parastagonospora nodorum]|nr:hypothetical protein HBH47_194230 [Parastagonospora nodorum]KAH4596645.1 hypothetical protein HBH82_224560 [Parastagonospora nodorum]KAH4662898.1 hypothetical protein HBH78_215090 [Parastagonospora nodorum]KAH4692913.1 hypothetical protein HBH67_230030 [Parastagonospora nodorum]KAH4764818.1 hypothetical protein HBH63_185560 [Parastagonospora nodorum]